MNMRTSGKFAAAFSCSKFSARLTGSPMFDCPEHNQTSPMSTSGTVRVFFPFTVSEPGSPLVFSLSKSTRHFPSAPAFVDFVAPAIVTEISSPAAAQPQTGAMRSHCNTMCSEKMDGSETSACNDARRAEARMAAT